MTAISESTHTVVYVGGPAHGRVEERPSAHPPREIRLPTFAAVSLTHGEAVYRRREMADTPGRIAYVFAGQA